MKDTIGVRPETAIPPLALRRSQNSTLGMPADAFIERVDIESYGSCSGQTRDLVLRVTVDETSGKNNTALAEKLLYLNTVLTNGCEEFLEIFFLIFYPEFFSNIFSIGFYRPQRKP